MLLTMHRNFPKLNPLKICQKEKPTAFEGYLSICGKDYFIHLDTPCFPYAEGIVIRNEIQLSEMLQSAGFESIKFKKKDTVLQYMKTLQDTCEKYLRDNWPHLHSALDHDEHLHLTSLFSQIEELGWEKVSEIAPDLSFIDLVYRDGRERSHILHLKIPPTYPSQPPSVEADLPFEMIHFTERPGRTLLSCFEAWKRCLLSLQLFWNVMDDLDDSAFVIDPTRPLRKHTARRILLGSHISLHLTVSPERPFSPPKCHLLGPSSLITPLNDRLVELYQIWDENESIVYNLEHILKVSVLKRNSCAKNNREEVSVLEEWGVECVVCYSFHFEDQLPDHTCDHCRKSFHLACLYDWLRSLPSSRQSGPFIRGGCPYCTKPVSCKVPAL